MPQDYIEIHGARANNLKNISLRIPKREPLGGRHTCLNWTHGRTSVEYKEISRVGQMLSIP
jgi:excinuclease UvrABC ATPase subunit